MSPKITWRQALAWRMARQQLEPVGTLAVEDLVRRLGAVQAQVASSAELAIRVRQRRSRAGAVAQALEDGRLVKTWAMRGTLHYLTPEEGPALLSLMASGRSWERPSWVRYFGMPPAVMERLREVTRETLDGRILTREELVEAIVARPGLDHVGEGLRSGWGTLLKPLAWQGDLVFGPSRGTRVTFMRPEAASPRWSGIPEPDEAAPRAIGAYLGAYGPATAEAFGSWLSGGWFGKRRLKDWFEGLGDRLAEVEVDGERAFVPADHLDELASTRPTDAVRLLPGFDQYVLGPGTADGHVLPPARRSAVSRQSGWIAPVVLAGGVVSGTWELDGDVVRVAWFGEVGPAPRPGLQGEVERLGGILGRPLGFVIDAPGGYGAAGEA